MTTGAPSQPKPRMPSDREIRRALIESGMNPVEAAAALSQLLRPPRLDFFKRRRNRLLRIVQERLVVVAAKRKLLEILTAEAEAQQRLLNLEDLFTGVHRQKLGNLGERVIGRAIRELAAEGTIKSQTSAAGVDLAGLTGKRYDLSAPKLREVHEKMRRAMGLKEAKAYVPEKRWDL
jgi:hypothetical protein